MLGGRSSGRPVATTKVARSGPRRPIGRRRPPVGSLAGRPREAAPAKSARPNFTGRAAVLALVLCAVVLTVAYPLRLYLAQRSEISGLQRGQRDGASQLAQLERANARWADPAYVRDQARSRLHMVLPGEPTYILLQPPTPSSTWMSNGLGPADFSGPWYSRLWSSLEAAGQSPGSR